MNKTVRFLVILAVVCLAIAAVLSRTYNWGVNLFTPGIVVAAILFIVVLVFDYRKRKSTQHFSPKKSEEITQKPKVDSEVKASEDPVVFKSEYRERKAGLNWGGGNVHAANASRGSRRRFMKR